MHSSLIDQAVKNIQDILREAIKHDESAKTIVVFDTQSPLSKIIYAAYQTVLPEATFMNFDEATPETIFSAINALHPNDLVILVQSTNFRLNEFRIRIELFKRDLKTIEHVHLARMSEDQFDRYIKALAYDKTYYRTVGPTLKQKIDQAKQVIVECAGTKLVYDTPMEETKLNVGDYTGMKNIGGTFPIGEVFSEAKDLTRVNGEVMIFAFADNDHMVKHYPPFKATIKDGILSATEAPTEFLETLELIKATEPVTVREFGLGLNRAINKQQILNDVTAFERMHGLHLSLGGKHTVYKKPGLMPKQSRYHVDIFVDVERIKIDNQIIFEQAQYVLN